MTSHMTSRMTSHMTGHMTGHMTSHKVCHATALDYSYLIFSWRQDEVKREPGAINSCWRTRTGCVTIFTPGVREAVSAIRLLSSISKPLDLLIKHQCSQYLPLLVGKPTNGRDPDAMLLLPVRIYPLIKMCILRNHRCRSVL